MPLWGYNSLQNQRKKPATRQSSKSWTKPGCCPILAVQHFSAEPAGDDPDAGFDVFLVGPGERRVALDSFSSGELELFNFVGWMLAARFEGGIICIDEPELHLDPQWHALILRALRNLQPNSQLIVATHSPE